LEHWKVLYWWAATEKNDDFCSFSLGFRELDYFIRHYQNSTEELVVQIKQLQSEKERLENEVAKLKEELDIEQETNQESAEVMDGFYRRQFIENQTPDILKEFSTDYLKISRENKLKDQRIKELENVVEATKKIVGQVEQEHHVKETKEQGIQTELSFQKINELEKQQKTILKTISDLTEQLINLQVYEEQSQTQIEVPPKK
jgi:hypothetical protein